MSILFPEVGNYRMLPQWTGPGLTPVEVLEVVGPEVAFVVVGFVLNIFSSWV